MKQVGIPLFYLQGMGGGAVLKFRDLFNDGSQYWAWRLYLGETSQIGKSGTEINGRYELVAISGKNAKWNSSSNEAPRLFMSPLAFPCEIITRLDTFTANADTYAELFVSKHVVRFGGNMYFSIGRRQAGICVTNTGALLATAAITTLPLWLRIRLSSFARYALNAYFDYSLDGLNWTNLWVQAEGFELFGDPFGGVGLCVRNESPYNEVVGGFDHFIMRPRSIN
ncbi:hypothetical protein ES703_16587 [subsurface metagenome]